MDFSVEKMERLYIDLNLTADEISAMYGATNSQVRSFCSKHGLRKGHDGVRMAAYRRKTEYSMGIQKVKLNRKAFCKFMGRDLEVKS